LPVIELPYAARDVFKPYHARSQRWACMVAHRRAGKTVCTINDLIRRAVRGSKPDGRYAYVAPYLAQGKEIAWDYLKRYALPITLATNEAELRVTLINGASIRIHGADNPDRLRGAYLDGVVLDEYADMRPSVWGEVVRPMLADRQGWATFIGTPKGHNGFYSLMYGGEDAPAGLNGAIHNPDWFACTLRASETELLEAAELADMRRTMTPEQYEQEAECSFEAAIRGAYFGREMAEAQANGRIRTVPADAAAPVHTAWDLGIGDSTAIWFFQVVGSEIHVIDHYEASGQALGRYFEVLEARGYDYGNHYLPHDARARELVAGRSAVEEFAKWQFPRVLPQMKVLDRINAARLTLGRCWFDQERCWSGLEALRQYRADWDEKAQVYRKEPKHDWASHSADAFCYLAAGWRELVPDVDIPDPVRALLPSHPGKTKQTLDEMMADLEETNG
jgi:phage terminase large subunit